MGCKNGMWLGKAKANCPNLVCLKYYFDDYERISKMFYDILLSYELDSILPVSIDEALIDCTTLCQTLDPLELMKEIKKKVLEKTQCSVSCGCGSNVLLAKLALRHAKPDGVYRVDQDNVLPFLNDVSFRSLPGIGPQICNKLATEFSNDRDTDITVGQIRTLKLDSLISMFGQKTGKTIFDYARGKDGTSIDILSNPENFTRKSISIDVNWGIRFDEPLEVEAFLGRMAKELNQRLIRARCVGSSIVLKLAIRHPSAPIEPEKYLGMGHCEFVSKRC
ncbi:unnamed protein product [Ambrosiozyma monospora]|uniref:Unnamed protein product n=1 Tax=Ambrosiozyma monospora TaxID=43982 RepID=A0ACB5U4V0_AMBMO|nr:unnamed protein product [Ambrosiozyma monospora]